MKESMLKKIFLIFSISTGLLFTGCIKNSYDMNMLSKKAHLSPNLAISAVKGDVSFSDIVKASDTIIFDQNKFVIVVFKKSTTIDLQISDFVKGVVKKTALIDPGSIDLNFGDILNKISGDFTISDPKLIFNYTSSFSDSVKIALNVKGTKGNKTVNLDLKPIPIVKPNLPAQTTISSSYIVDKSNSNLPDLMSLLPEFITYSGTATLTAFSKSSSGENALANQSLTGTLDVEIPTEFKIANLQFSDTVDNFLNKSNGDDPLKPEDFQYLSVNISAKNGFPLGVSVKMSIYDSATKSNKSTVTASNILDPAPVDGNGKVTGVTESTAVIELTKDFFSTVTKGDKIIIWLNVVSTGNGLQDVKIYSDYRISFNAALVVKPDINLN